MSQLTSPHALHALVNDLFGNYRMVDLSDELFPGVLSADNHYRWSRTPRPFELRQWVSPGGHYQHFMETVSQVGTHVETPAHIVEGTRAGWQPYVACRHAVGDVLR